MDLSSLEPSLPPVHSHRGSRSNDVHSEDGYAHGGTEQSQSDAISIGHGRTDRGHHNGHWL